MTILTAVGAVLIQQFYFKANNNYQIRTDLLRQNYEYYRSAQNLSDLGNFGKIVIVPGNPEGFFEFEYEDGVIDTLKIRDMVIAEFEVAIVAVDSAQQEQWLMEKNFIIKNKNKINQRVYRKFLNVVYLVNQNPWPHENSPNVLKHSVWTKQKFLQKWRIANKELSDEVNNLIGF